MKALLASLLARFGQDRDLRSLLLGTGAGVALRGVEVVAKLGLYVLAGRRLGLHDAGLFFLCLNIAHFGGVAGRLGLDRALTRFLAAELAVDRPASARRLVALSLLAVTGATAVLAAAIVLLAGPLARHVFREPALAGPLALSAVVLGGIAAAQMAASILSGLKRPGMAQVAGNALWPTLACVALLLPLGLGATILAVGGAYFVSALVGFAVAASDLGALAGQPDTGPPPPDPIRPAAASLLMVELVQALLLTFPTIALGMFEPAEAVGAFSLANRISLMVWMVLLSVWSIAGPVFSERHRRGETSALGHANAFAQMLGAALGAPLALAMIAVPGPLLAVISPDFRLGAGALAILGAGQLVNALCAAQDLMLAMTGNNRAIRWLNAGQLVVCVGGTLALVPFLGMEGAALATALATGGGALAAGFLVPPLVGVSGFPMLRIALRLGRAARGGDRRDEQGRDG